MTSFQFSTSFGSFYTKSATMIISELVPDLVCFSKASESTKENMSLEKRTITRFVMDVSHPFVVLCWEAESVAIRYPSHETGPTLAACGPLSYMST